MVDQASGYGTLMIVVVTVVDPPKTAPADGVPRVIVTVSPLSETASVSAARVRVAVVAPMAIDRGVAGVREKSVAGVAVPVTAYGIVTAAVWGEDMVTVKTRF
jgi:hypothetical protein